MSSAIEELERLLGPGQVLLGDAIPERHYKDWSTVPATPPLAVLRPRSTEEVAACLRICHEHGQTVVPQGGLTGVSGGACPRSSDVCLSLDRLVGIEELDATAATVTVLAGTPLEQIQIAAREAGFICPLDLGARGSCAIGGNISTNAGGNRVVKYGMTREMVLGLEVVLADGTILRSLNRMLKNNAGYDLKQLFIGSEGTLGVVTRAVLRLHPAPLSSGTAFCGLADVSKAIELLTEARRHLLWNLSAFEVLWPAYVELVDKHTRARSPLADHHGIYVLMETQGTDPQTDSERFEAFLARMFDARIIEDAAVAQSAQDAIDFWRIRDSISEIAPVIAPRIEFDIGLPIRAIGPYTEQLEEGLRARWPDVILIYYGHLADGNVHVQVAVPGRVPHPDHEIEHIVYGLLQQHGGTVTAEHGLGTLKAGFIHISRTPEEIAVMHRLKEALDPQGILNPGKVLIAPE